MLRFPHLMLAVTEAQSSLSGHMKAELHNIPELYHVYRVKTGFRGNVLIHFMLHGRSIASLTHGNVQKYLSCNPPSTTQLHYRQQVLDYRPLGFGNASIIWESERRGNVMTLQGTMPFYVFSQS